MHEEAVRFVKESTKDTFRAEQTSQVYDVNGTRIMSLRGTKDVSYLTSDEIPEEVKEAMVSIEDKKFYSHGGIDFKAIIRAVWAMVRNGEVTQGGSTITQQLARTIFLNNDRTWQRKMEEIFIATELEKKYTKDEILEFYLNNIYFEMDIMAFRRRAGDILIQMFHFCHCPRWHIFVRYRIIRRCIILIRIRIIR